MNRFKNILFVADTSSKSCPAFERAIALAERNHARLTVVDVVEEYSDVENIQKQIGISLNQLIHDHRMQVLTEMVAPYQTQKQIIYTKVLMGTAFIEIIKAVIQNGYDLVIKAMHPPADLSERLLGSTDMHLLRKCPCPVWIDRPGKEIPYKKIVAAVDPVGNEQVALRVLQLATSLAEREQAKLEVVHAWRLQGESLLRGGYARLSDEEVELFVSSQQKLHATKFDKVLADFGLSTKSDNVHFVKGYAAQQILECCVSADLIVMGTIGRVGIPGLFIGNTAEEVMQMTQSSILAVKPEGFLSPLT